MFSSRLSLELNKGRTKMERSPGAGQCKFKPQLHNAAHSPERLRLKISTSTPTAGDLWGGEDDSSAGPRVQGHECHWGGGTRVGKGKEGSGARLRRRGVGAGVRVGFPKEPN